MKSQRDYKKEFNIQKALGTLPIFLVKRIDVDNICRRRLRALFEINHAKYTSYFLSTEIRAVSLTHAIDCVMKKYNFPEEARQYLMAVRSFMYDR